MRDLAWRVIAGVLLLAGPAAADDRAACHAHGEPDQKIAACSSVISAGKASNSDLSLAYNARGFALMRKRAFDPAISDFSKAIELNPASAAAYNNRGWAFSEKREYDRSIPDLDKAIDIDPALANAYTNRGWALNRRKEYDRALRDFDKAVELNPQTR